jgi:LacI family transcriptional regulator
VDKFLFNPYKSASFRQQARSLVNNRYNGVLVAPFFYRESLEFFERCRGINLPYITFNTYIQGSRAICHIGQDLVQSGKTAASLMQKIVPPKVDILIIHVEEVLENAKHMQEKEAGFRQFFNSDGYQERNLYVLTLPSLRKIEKVILQALDANKDIKGIFVSTSKVHTVARILGKHSMNLGLIGYDLLEENIRYLGSGGIDFLIYQNSGLQASQGISTLVDHIVFKADIPERKLLPIEIIIRENIKNYIQR